MLRAIKDRDGLELLTALVESGANINLPTLEGAYPIHVAVATGNHNTVLFLLNKEASVKARRHVSASICLHRCACVGVHVCIQIEVCMYIHVTSNEH